MITPAVWCSWFTNAFVYYGLTFIIPFTMSLLNEEEDKTSTSNDITSLYWIAVAEFPGFLFTWIFADTPCLGRRKSQAYCFLIIAALLGYFVVAKPISHLILIASIAKLFINMTFTLVY